MSGNKIELPEEKFDVIYADPPWRFGAGKITCSRSIENHYPTMALEDIVELDVPSISKDDCILYLWTTNTHLEDALGIMKKWGFQYQNNWVWDKEMIGLGSWVRVQHELILIGSKGKAKAPEPEFRVSSVYRQIRRQHSAKPNYFRKKITQWYPDAKKVELFSRGVYRGWSVWGNECKGGLLK